MSHYGVLREYRFEGSDDVRGAEVYGVNDEKLGTIDDVVFDHASGDIRYIVLNTGGIFSRKRVMVPASRISPYGKHEDKFYAELDKERVEMLPEFDNETLTSKDRWSAYEKAHEQRWNEGAVLYNKETGRVVTPPADQVESSRREPLSEEAKRSLDRDLTPQRMGKQDALLGTGGTVSGKTTMHPKKASIAGKEDVREVTLPMGSEMEVPVEKEGERVRKTMREPGIYRVGETPEIDSGNLGSRWSGFQGKLRDRRDKIIVDCPQCGSQEKVA